MSAAGSKSSWTAASAAAGSGGGGGGGGGGKEEQAKETLGVVLGGGGAGAAGTTATTGNLPSSRRCAAAASTTSTCTTTGVMDYLQTWLPQFVLLQLYTEEAQGRFVCRAVLQHLSAPAQQVVLRLLSSSGGTFPLSGVQMWTHSPNPVQTTDRILKELHGWAMIHKDCDNDCDYQPATTTNNNNNNNSNSNSNNKTGGGSNTVAAGGRKRNAAGHGGDYDDDGGDDAENDDKAAAAAASTSTFKQQPQQQQPMVTLTDEFRTGLQAALLHWDASPSPWVPITHEQIVELERQEKITPSKPVTPEELERHSQQQWDALLHFCLVGSTSSGKPKPPPSAVVQFLKQTGLMQEVVDPKFRCGSNVDPSNADMDMEITEKGYDFMLQDKHQQLWHFVLHYLQSLETYQDKVPVLVLLICLSFARVGQAYLITSTTSSIHHKRNEQEMMIQDLAPLGLWLTRNIGTKVTLFYPTRLAMQLLLGNQKADRSALALESALSNTNPQNSSCSHLAIIVQTNFQVCAYTTSELHVSMLALFCDANTIRRLPNVVFGTLTRDSVKGALAKGIQARHILRFLETHAHPQLRSGVSVRVPPATLGVVPENVQDQIWLWDREVQTRVQFTEVYRHECLLPGEFQAVVEFVETQIGNKNGCHAWWSSVQTQQPVILMDYQHVERVQNYVRQWRATQQAAAAAGAAAAG